jgi:hypothetical protein
MKVKSRVLRHHPTLRRTSKRRARVHKPKRRPWRSMIDIATVDAAIAETKAHRHALMRDSVGCYLLMLPIDEETVNVIPLHTCDKARARAAADEELRRIRH